MSDYISWLKTDDVAFRAYYLSKTGENVQADPIDNDLYWQVGSSRLNASMITELNKFASVLATKSMTTYKNAKQLANESKLLDKVAAVKP